MTDLSDISLITQVTVFHNRQAFNRRFFLNQTLGDEQLSDDLAQDTFIKAYTNLQKFRGLSNFSTWLFRIAYNVHYDYVRSHHMTEDYETSTHVKPERDRHDTALQMDLYDALR